MRKTVSLSENKKKKKTAGGYMTITTGDIEKNIKHFNTCAGTDFSNPSTEEAKAAAAEAAEASTGAATSTAGNGEAAPAASGDGGAMSESLTLQESSWTFESESFEDGFYVECRWDKYAGYEVISGWTRSDGVVADDYHKSYSSKEAAMVAYKRLYNKHKKELAAVSTDNPITEATKREIKRYYVRPQNIFCSNKADILRVLADLDGENCSIYSLKKLTDHDDVHKLTNDDIIYYYDDRVLYDKNHVQVIDYDLFVKHEEERKSIDPDQVSDSEFIKNYDDRMTDLTNDTDEIRVAEALIESTKTTPTDVGQELIRALKEASANFKVLHRNLIGGNWLVVHPLIGEYYEKLDEFEDLICENLLSIGIKDITIDTDGLIDVKDYDEQEALSYCKAALDNIKILANRCRTEINLPADVVPAFDELCQWIEIEADYKLAHLFGDKVVDQAVTVSAEQDAEVEIHENLTEDASYYTSYKGYDIYRENDGTFWCQKGYTDQCWDMTFNSLREVKAAIDEEIQRRSNYDWDDEDCYEAFNCNFEARNAYGETLHEGKSSTEVCCICGEEIDGYGNNAEPYKEGTCCDACNNKFVIPARIEQLNKKDD